MGDHDLLDAPLGKKSDYIAVYTPQLLYPIPRSLNRHYLNITSKLPFSGVDIWNAYELSWLDARGKPHIAAAEFYIPCESENLIESKSFKLYLNSFNQTRFDSADEVLAILHRDISASVGAHVEIKLILPHDFKHCTMQELVGICLDDLPISVDTYSPHPEFLSIKNEPADECIYSNLLKSNCAITRQPDWASLYIHYQGKKINHDGLLKYIISLRQNNEFHEPCVERIFMDILQRCHCEKLTVYARYTRRGGLDINPFRSNFEKPPYNVRSFRQ